ncbi:hypothetical protein GOB18_07885 [Sinorhizobium meliloti]|nr:hypothetical protein [Sinorhizobium meliloti]MDW9453685.1 hypothetical protein [Sinorhizobium meliloti]
MRILLALSFLCLLSADPARAQVFSTIAGSVLIDRAGGEARDSIDHAKAAASALVERANEAGRQRLDQIDQILKTTVADLIGQTEQSSLRILAQMKADLDALRAATLTDLKGVIWAAECAGTRLVLEDLQNSLGSLGKLLNTHQIQISPPIPVIDDRPWYCTNWWCDSPDIVEIKQPFGDTYIEVRNKMEKSLSGDNVTEETPAHRIVGTYEYLSAFALKTSCFYPGSSEVWNREYVAYREKARQWRNVLDIRID